jgi:hydroxyethylthiazole kinase-like uncharacterized protein yjeF
VPGAALLAGVSALRAGAGKLQLAAGPDWAAALALAVPEARVIRVAVSPNGELSARAVEQLADPAVRTDAVVVGPGMLDEGAAAELVRAFMTLKTRAAFLLDAAALTGLEAVEDLKPLSGRAVLTPHAGEMAKLLNVTKEVVERDPVAIARKAAAQAGSVLVLKGATTYIADPDGRLLINEDGAIGLGTGGSGDVLAGVIGGLLARGAEPLIAAAWGVHLHARAGEALSERVGPLGFLAREIPDEIPRLLRDSLS